MRQSTPRKNSNKTQETEKATFQVVKRIREAILDEIFKPGDHLGEAELAEKFEVSRSPVRETLLALEKEGTAIMGRFDEKGNKVRQARHAEIQPTAFALLERIRG